ncbi:hypothetical protein BJ170DRAFT_487044 [Xylariales sp. AK1849]|nr:hypothetical protein BJ170DRAFT_487044 [Xylariales sp. AK1849]
MYWGGLYRTSPRIMGEELPSQEYPLKLFRVRDANCNGETLREYDRCSDRQLFRSLSLVSLSTVTFAYHMNSLDVAWVGGRTIRGVHLQFASILHLDGPHRSTSSTATNSPVGTMARESILPSHHVRVRDYTWHWGSSRGIVQSRQVQSPHLDLQKTQPPYIVRPVDGNRLHETILVEDASALHDDIRQQSYTAEAQGFILIPGSSLDVHPVWACLDAHSPNSPFPIDVVDLVTFEKSEYLCSDICWVPQRQRSDGALITLLDNVPKRLLNKESSTVVVHTPGSPKNTGLTRFGTTELSGCLKITDDRRHALLETQLTALRAITRTSMRLLFTGPDGELSTMPSLFQANLKRLVFFSARPGASYEDGNALEEDVEYSWSDWSSNNSDVETCTDCSLDDDLVYDDAIEIRRSAPPNRAQLCCNDADLGPSFWDMAPTHWHKEDHHCPLRSRHSKHCIFAGSFPEEEECMRSAESHVHCSALTPAWSSSSPGAIDPRDYRLEDCTETTEGLTLASDPGEVHITPVRTGDEILAFLGEVSPYHFVEAYVPTAPDPIACFSMPTPLSPGYETFAPTPPFRFFETDGMELDGPELVGPQIGTSDHGWKPYTCLDALPSSPGPPEMRF